MNKKEHKPYVRPIRSGDYPPSVPLKGMSYHNRRHLPWQFVPREDWENGLTFISGDATHAAVLWMGNDTTVYAKVQVLHSDRSGRILHEGPADGWMAALSKLERGRVMRLFEEWPRDRLAQQGHLHWGRHSEFCPKHCAYVVLPIDQAERDAARNRAWSKR